MFVCANTPGVIICGLLLMFVIACAKKDREKGDDEQQKITTTMQSNRERLLLDLPPASAVASQLRMSGAKYQADLVNDLSMVARYLDKNAGIIAANTGVYLADFGYVNAYGDAEGALRMLETCQQMAAQLGAEQGFRKAVEDRFQWHLEADDSLKARFEQMFEGAEDQGVVGDEEWVQVAFLTGYFTEGLYLVASFIQHYTLDDVAYDVQLEILQPLLQVFLDQKDRVQQLLEIFARYNTGEKGMFFYDELFKMNEEFRALELSQDPEIRDVQEFLDDPHLSTIFEHVQRMRHLIVS